MKMRVLVIEAEGEATAIAEVMRRALSPDAPEARRESVDRATEIRKDADERRTRLRRALTGPANR